MLCDNSAEDKLVILEKDPHKSGYYIIFWFIEQIENWKKKFEDYFFIII